MLKIEHIGKRFGDKEVLKDLSLEVKEGSIFGLVGVNGAGKSTLLRLIAGVYESEEGRILLNEQDTFHNERIRSQIAFVPDDPYYPFGSTVESLKLFYKSLYDFDEAAYRSYLDIFELNPKETITNLSKGMKRRVSLLFALSIHPKLLLLDEAYDGLEPLARLRFKNILSALIEDEGVSVIISSHNLKELEDICDSFGILENGAIVSYGDLLESKGLVNKYQLAFKETKTKEDFADFDVIHFESEGQVYKLVIRGDLDEVNEKLEAMDPILLNVLQINFEELFVYELESRGKSNE